MENIENRIEELINQGFTEMYTRQYRDFAVDCPVKPAKDFGGVWSGKTRYSGQVNGILVNPDTDQYVEFHFGRGEIWIEEGFKNWAEGTRIVYERNR